MIKAHPVGIKVMIIFADHLTSHVSQGDVCTTGSLVVDKGATVRDALHDNREMKCICTVQELTDVESGLADGVPFCYPVAWMIPMPPDQDDLADDESIMDTMEIIKRLSEEII